MERAESEELRMRIEQMAAESGNAFRFSEAEVFDTDLSYNRDDAPQLVDEETVKRLSLQRVNMKLHGAKGRRCSAQTLFDVCDDEEHPFFL